MNALNSSLTDTLDRSAGWRIQFYYNLAILVGLVIFGGLLFLSVGMSVRLSEISGHPVAVLTVVIPFGFGIVSAVGFFIAVIAHLVGKFPRFWNSLFAVNYGISVIGYSVFNLPDVTTAIHLVATIIVSAVVAAIWVKVGLIQHKYILVPVGAGVLVPYLFGLPSFGLAWLLLFAFLFHTVRSRGLRAMW